MADTQALSLIDQRGILTQLKYPIMSITNCNTAKLSLEDIRSFHSRFSLCGESRNALLNAPDNFLEYLLALLHFHPAIVPQTGKEEWFRFLKLLIPHYLLPFLYCLNRSFSSKENRIPLDVNEYLRKTFLASSTHYLNLQRQFEELDSVFKKENIPVLALKGFAFAHSLYEYPAARASGDLDLLILPQDVSLVRALLKDLGYVSCFERFSIFDEFHCEEQFLSINKQRRRCGIDLHWDIHPFSSFNRTQELNELFSRAITVHTPTSTFKTLHPVDALIQAVLHLCLSHNQDIRLIWIYDIALLAASLNNPEWRILQKRSLTWGGRIALEQALTMVKLWTGFNPPLGFDDFTKWPPACEIEHRAWHNLVLSHSSLMSKFLLYWPGSARLGRKVCFILHLLFPPPVVIRRIYPFSPWWLLPTAYIRRWLRWLKSYSLKGGFR